jgi:hypothetical protein
MIKSISRNCFCAAAMLALAGAATAQVPANRILAVPPSWATNQARKADTAVIATTDKTGQIVNLCGNVSGQCSPRVYGKPGSKTSNR